MSVLSDMSFQNIINHGVPLGSLMGPVLFIYMS